MLPLHGSLNVQGDDSATAPEFFATRVLQPVKPAFFLTRFVEAASALFARFNGGENGTLWYYDSLANVFLRLGPKELAEELDRTVEEMYRQSGRRRPDRVSLERSNGTSFATVGHSAQG